MMGSSAHNSPHRDTTQQLPSGRLVVFWSWMGIIIVGLAIMIAVPLGGQ
ncbi:hypothetical protein [Microbacterium sp. NC79]|nr:hypothetical protein [Microbacterium sp. NC79]MBV0895990.1 hypothetical protein [Microbacterium sp. NC79]